MSCVDQGWGQEKTCKFKNKGTEYEANDGEVVEVKKTKLRLCENGKTVLKKKTEFKLPYKFACRGQYLMKTYINIAKLCIVFTDIYSHHKVAQISLKYTKVTLFS